MQNKILLFTEKERIYNKLAEDKAINEDYSTALGFLFKSKKISKDCEIYGKIADIYTDMGLLEYSNKYWFKYMSLAPKYKKSIAYEELAINYFYMENLWASGYYFHLKLTTDGFISKEGLDQEILDFFSGEEIKKSAYRVVYPYDKADYTLEIKNGKRAIAMGNCDEGARILYTVPEEARTTEISEDLTIALIMGERLDEAEQVCRSDIKRNGETAKAYCNLSTIYNLKEEFDKSQFYYNKALITSNGDKGDAYRIATCSIEWKDHPTLIKCLDIILSDRPYDVTMRFFRGLARINLKDYSGAMADFKFVYRIDPADIIVKFYIDFTYKLIKGDIEREKLLPLTYLKDVPEKYATKFSKIISKTAKQPDNIKSFVKKQENMDMIIWGMHNGDDRTMRESVYLLSLIGEKEFYKIALDVLADPESSEPLKSVLIYAMIIRNYRGRMGIVAGTYYIDFKPKKLKCESDDDGLIYFASYALCVSRMVFYDIDNFDKIATITDKVFNKFKGVLTEAEITNEEISALVLYECKYTKYSQIDIVTSIFNVNEKKLKLLITLYEEEITSKKGRKGDK